MEMCARLGREYTGTGRGDRNNPLKKIKVLQFFLLHCQVELNGEGEEKRRSE